MINADAKRWVYIADEREDLPVEYTQEQWLTCNTVESLERELRFSAYLGGDYIATPYDVFEEFIQTYPFAVDVMQRYVYTIIEEPETPKFTPDWDYVIDRCIPLKTRDGSKVLLLNNTKNAWDAHPLQGIYMEVKDTDETLDILTWTLAGHYDAGGIKGPRDIVDYYFNNKETIKP